MKNHFFTFLVICLALGILLSESVNPAPKLRIYFIITFFGLFFSLLIRNKIIQTTSIGLQIFLLGILVHSTNNNQLQTNFSPDKTPKIYHVKIEEIYKPSAKYLKFKVKNLSTHEISMSYFPKNFDTIYPMDTLVVLGKLSPLFKPLNPNQFDYSNYLKLQNITSSLYVSDILIHNSNHFSWNKITAKSKKNIREKMKNFGYSTETRSIVSSMLLGDRTEISSELNESYIATGVVHILSISGLHVVMIYIILQFVLRPLLTLKNGHKIRIIIALIIIWIFAFYVDMQPPVFRSALMISIYYISELLKRPKNIYHTISLSAFIILIIQPNYLFDVGFQLSFSAVFFIVWLHPIFKKMFQPKHQIPRYIYELSTTSISAQLGTMPFATYYFNQFSGLFLLGNLVLIPASFLMIIGSLIALLLIILDLDFQLYVTLFNFFIETCNAYIKWLSSFEGLIFKQVYISPLVAFCLLIALYFLRPLVLKKSRIALVGCVVSIFIIQINRFFDVKRIRNSHEIIIFHQYKQSLIGVRNGQDLKIFSSENLDSSLTKLYTIRPYQLRNRIRNTDYFSLDSVVNHPEFYKSKSVLVVENHRIFIGQNLTEIPEEIDYILVRNSNFKPNHFNNLDQIKRVIADGSNYPSYVSELDSLLKIESDSIFWKTSEKGFFQIKF